GDRRERRGVSRHELPGREDRIPGNEQHAGKYEPLPRSGIVEAPACPEIDGRHCEKANEDHEDPPRALGQHGCCDDENGADSRQAAPRLGGNWRQLENPLLARTRPPSTTLSTLRGTLRPHSTSPGALHTKG